MIYEHLGHRNPAASSHRVKAAATPERSQARFDLRAPYAWRVHARTALAALAIAAASAGCGSQHASGAALFAEDCATCHSLTGRQSPRRQGGDLLALHITRAQMLEFVREMPVPHKLSSAQLQAVADYVRSVEARGA